VAGQEQETEKPPAKKAKGVDPNSPDYRPPADNEDRDKLLDSIKVTLNNTATKPAHSKKSDDDFFVVGTIDLKKRHAIVDFVIKEGVQKAADFIADFVLGKERGAIREWRIFARAKTMKAAEVLRLKAKSESIEDRLIAFKRNTSGKKTPDDFFVVGTADLNPVTENADIRFEVLAGVKAAADFLINFIFNRPTDHKGEWHVFYRAGTEAQATDYRQQMRDWYDSMEAQRAEMAAIYNAKTTVRC
jgi:hypothetical protein